MQDQRMFIENLNAAHAFPCAYTFKVIGENTPELLNGALRVMALLVPGVEPRVSKRESSHGRHVSLTLELTVQDAETVVLVYAELRRLGGLKMLL